MIQAQAPVATLRFLRSVALRTPDLGGSADFYGDVWGLKPTDNDTNTVWLRGTGGEHHILQLLGSDGGGLEKICFAVATRAEVDEAAGRLERQGIPVVTPPGWLDQAGGGYGLRFVDPEGRLVELSCETWAVTPEDPEGRAAVPQKIAHVVLNTTDIDRMCSFYTGVLGMRVSDWSEHQMVFLRVNHDHHCIAFNQAPHASINHVAYEMPTVDHFMRGIGRLRHHGRTPLWGPGMHGPGSVTFSYFADPAGLVCEYTSGAMEVDEDTWVCRVWRRTPELSDLWGTAGAPSEEVRAGMAGQPDPGWFARNPQ
jgi:catechol 2,3-dioxygenase-like lactoylglutathione lyase family enzyme